MTGSSRQPLRRIGDFLILEEIGRGGMGVVYRAEQISMSRVVALKILPSLIGLDQSSVARFRREAETAGRISHPGIVPVYAVGEENGIHYFAMEYVDGPGLDRLLETIGSRPAERLLGSLFEESGLDQTSPGVLQADRKTSGTGSRYARSCARIAAEVASALVAAHREGVIHRDLKPSNILVRSNGQPVLLDFGLARDQGNLGLTRSGDAIGTPNYMAPEQACGQTDTDGRADVWGLGATLYEMLTLRPPFNGANAAEIMRRIVDNEPIAIRSLNPRIPEDLARIVETCLRKERDARYPAVEALELDLRNYLADRPVLARRSGLARRSLRFLSRNRVSVTVGTAVLVATTGLFAVMGAVSDRESAAAGRRALEEAGRAIAQDLALEDAQSAYGRARALLGADAVRSARREHIGEHFESLYVGGRFNAIADYLDTWAASDRDEIWRQMRERVDGRGSLAITGLPAGTRVRVRFVDAEGRLGVWADAPPSGRFALGNWIAEVEAPGRARVVHAFTIARDLVVHLDPLLYALSELPQEFDGRVVPEDSDGFGVLVARTELSNDELGALLAAHRGTLLADELRPSDWPGEGVPAAGTLPARGISWRQARLIAILSGAHLPSRREYELASTAGVPRLHRPFGNAMRWDLVAASATGGLGAPLPVDSLDAGASPHGILHLIGNVREWLAAGADEPCVAIGGDFTCDVESELRIDGDRSSLELLPAAEDRRIGVRLARFLPPRQSSAEHAKTTAKFAEMLSASAVVSEWRIERNGEVTHELGLRGRHAETSDHVDLALVTPGFLQEGPPVTRDGFGNELTVETTRRALDVSALRVHLPEPGRKGQGFKLSVLARLAPLDGLWAAGSEHRFVLPLRHAVTARQTHVLRMPRSARIDQVEPAPSLRFVDDDREVLVWDLTANSDARAIVGCALIRFRVDGALTDRWPSFQSGSEALRTMCESFGAALSAERFARLFEDDFTLLPHGLGRSGMTSPSSAPRDRFEVLRVDDVTAVGQVIGVRARVRWRAPAPAWRGSSSDALETVADDWPVVAFFRRHDDGLRAIWFGPEPQSDRGSFTRGRYRYEPMDFSIEVPSGITLVRDRGQAAEVQLLLRAQAGNLRDTYVQVLGYRADASGLDADPIDRLTMGEAFAPGSHRLPTRDPDGSGVGASDWLFDGGVGAWRRERWQRIDVGGGRWRFLVRFCARGKSEADARAWFDRPEAQEFFATLLAGIRLPGDQRIGDRR